MTLSSRVYRKEAVDPQERAVPIVTCEHCGKTNLAHKMIGFYLVVGSPGHEDLPPFHCGANQGDSAYNHWTCPNEECFDAVVVACRDEHVKVILDELHAQLGDKGSWLRKK